MPEKYRKEVGKPTLQETEVVLDVTRLNQKNDHGRTDASHSEISKTKEKKNEKEYGF